MEHQILFIKKLSPIEGNVLEVIKVKRDHNKGIRAEYTFRLNGTFAKKMFYTSVGAKKAGMEQIKALTKP